MITLWYTENMHIENLVIKSLTTRVAPMVYIMVGVSLIIGFCFMTGFLVAPDESVLFNATALIPFAWWGGLLFGTAALTEIGLYLKNWGIVSASSIFGFMLWLLATIGLVMFHNWYAVLTFGIFHLLFWGYIYLASSLGVLERFSLR